MNDRGQEVIRIGRAARNRDHRLAQHFGHAGRAGRVGAGRGHAAPGGAGADRNHRSSVGGAFLEQVDGSVAADLAVIAIFLDRNRTLDDQHVLALVGLHRVLACRFGLVSGGSHQGLVVVQRNDFQNQFFQRWMLGTQQGFGAAGAFLKVQPDHGRPLGRLDRLRHCSIRPLGQTHGDRQRGAELQVVASGHAKTLFDAVQSLTTQREDVIHFAHVVSWSQTSIGPDRTALANSAPCWCVAARCLEQVCLPMVRHYCDAAIQTMPDRK